MAKHVSETPATQWLKRRKISFGEHVYAYVEHGGTAESALQLGVDEHCVIKTLVMENEKREPLIILMHGDRKVSTKELARQTGFKQIAPCDPAVAQRHTGYMVGGTSPFGTRKALPVFMEQTILELPLIYINGGKWGFLVGIHPHDIIRTLHAKLVHVAIE